MVKITINPNSKYSQVDKHSYLVTINVTTVRELNAMENLTQLEVFKSIQNDVEYTGKHNSYWNSREETFLVRDSKIDTFIHWLKQNVFPKPQGTLTKVYVTDNTKE